MSKDPNQPPSEEKERQYQSIFDSASDGLIITDLETGLVLEANPAACKMHGYTREEFIGLQLTAFIHPESQHGFSERHSSIKGGHVCWVLSVTSANGSRPNRIFTSVQKPAPMSTPRCCRSRIPWHPHWNFSQA